MLAAPRRLFVRRKGRLEARIAGADEAQLDHLEQARVEVRMAEGGAIMALFLAPRLELDRRADLRGAHVPDLHPVAAPAAGGAFADPVGRRPPHSRRTGVDVRVGYLGSGPRREWVGT